MIVKHGRPLAIFIAYFTANAVLLTTCVCVILSPRRRVNGVTPSQASGDYRHGRSATSRRVLATVLFTALAIFSLATTWYYMFRFFQWSYTDWAQRQNLELASDWYIGAWLRDTKLFRQAWASTLETAPRAWWSLQIFSFCASWSVMVAVEGV